MTMTRADEQQDVLHEASRAPSGRAPASRRRRTSCAHTRRPVFSRSKKSSPSVMRWRNTRTRRSRRNSSPILRDGRIDGAAEAPARCSATPRYSERRLVERRRRRPPSSPLSMPYRTSTGPASRHAVWTDEERRQATMIVPRHGRSMPPQPPEQLLRLLAVELSRRRRGAEARRASARIRLPAPAERRPAGACALGVARARRGTRSDVASELLVRALGDDAAVVEQHDPVGERDRRRRGGR